jgi:predicted amidohydrolase
LSEVEGIKNKKITAMKKEKLSDQKIKIAMAQTDCVLADIDKNLETHYRFIEQAIDNGQDIIVFPELSLTGYSLKDAVYDVALPAGDGKYDKLRDMSRHISIIVGAVELSERFEIFNSLLCFEDGRLLSRHRKVYLPTYGLFEE